MQAAEKSALPLYTLYLIPAIYQLKGLSEVKQLFFYEILLLDNKIFLDSLFGIEKVVIGIAAIESSVLAAKVYFTLHYLGSEDVARLSSNIVA